jgi:hypothetical protein
MKKLITEQHRKNLSKALMGNKNSVGKNLGNKNAYGKTRGEKNGNWNGGNYGVPHKERLAGRSRNEECEICRKPCLTDFDHDHNTGQFRGWICRRCNLVLGMVKDDRKLLRLLADYLDINDDKTRPSTVININVFLPNNSDKQNSGDEEENPSGPGGNVSE